MTVQYGTRQKSTKTLIKIVDLVNVFDRHFFNSVTCVSLFLLLFFISLFLGRFFSAAYFENSVDLLGMRTPGTYQQSSRP